MRSPKKPVAGITGLLLIIASALVWAGGSPESPGQQPPPGASGTEAPASDNSAGDSEQPLLTLQVATMPILPVSQYYIIKDQGWDHDAGLDFQATVFQSGPPIVQALGNGQLDVQFFGIGPAMVAAGRGQDLRVVASLIVEQMSFLADSGLAEFWQAQDPGGTFARFREARGRRAKIATFQEGSVPHVVLLYWLEEILGAGTEDVEILGMGANGVQQALLSGAVDGASTLEPIVTIVQDRRPDIRVLASGSELFPNQPGAVVTVRQAVLDEHPGLGATIAGLVERATRFIRENPAKAAEILSRTLGGGLIDQGLIEKAVRTSIPSFTADPRVILESAKRMHNFQLETGSLAAPVDVDQLIQTEHYEQAIQ
ncbi:ABC transporter substrate-binding protein [Spirochaeta lutea]|uniref:ABC transporter substrate-binding protein n=1 Tax=Spirochaeta lutea TaxID=1480694 RepID=UPI00068D7AA3|nr:ABC transporter substrate-binding protein [Spirochaeta lutea]